MARSENIVRRRSLLTGLGTALAAQLARPAIVKAEGSYPNKTVRYINPYPAGGPADTLSRLFCAKMSELSGLQWVVENKGGAGGNVGVAMLAQSAPDGYTLGLGGIASHADRTYSLRQTAVQPADGLHFHLDHLAAPQHAGGQSERPGQDSAWPTSVPSRRSATNTKARSSR